MQKDLSVIIPAYNEAGRIGGTIDEVAAYLRGRAYRFEILVINDGSTDATAAEVRSRAAASPEIRLIDHSDNRGKGARVKEGIREAVFPTCLFMDADNATSIREWPGFERCFESGAKAVIASRHLVGSKIERPQPFMRRFLGSGYRVICRVLFGLSVSDFNCGFKAYETAVAKTVYAQVVMTDWTFDVEAFCLLKRAGIAIAEVPVHWRHYDKPSDRSLWGPVRTALRTLKSVWVLKQRF